jgi:hypothetical protein
MNTVPAPSNPLLLFWVLLAIISFALTVLWWSIWRLNRDTSALAWGWAMLWFGSAFAINALIRSIAADMAATLIYLQRTSFAVATVMVWVAADCYLASHNGATRVLWRWRFPWHRDT